MKIVTGYRGTAHISSKDDQGRNRGLVGADSYVLGGANEFSATLVSNNELQIGPGEGILQGVHFRVEPGSYDSLTIENGSQGMQRKDLVVCRYTKDSSTGVEGTEWVVIKGTAVSSNPVRPSYTSGDVASGALVADMPFYEIVINDINVTAVNPLFSVLKTMQELKAQQDTNTSAITALNSRTGTVRFILTNGTKLSRGTAIGYYDKATGTVRINFSFTASSAISANETIFSAIPSAYRPASNMGGSGVIVTSASATPVFYTYTANSSGNIIQTLGNTVMSGMGYIEYEV